MNPTTHKVDMMQHKLVCQVKKEGKGGNKISMNGQDQHE